MHYHRQKSFQHDLARVAFCQSCLAIFIVDEPKNGHPTYLCTIASLSHLKNSFQPNIFCQTEKNPEQSGIIDVTIFAQKMETPTGPCPVA